MTRLRTELCGSLLLALVLGCGSDDTEDKGTGGTGGRTAGAGGMSGAGGTAGGGAGGAAGSGSNDAPRSTGPGDWSAGDYPPNLTEQTYLEITGLEGQDGNVRQYKVHVPPSYAPEVPAPVVFCFHGLGQNAVMFCVDGAGIVDKSDAEGFVVVMPNGVNNSWNGGACCATDPVLDDVGFIRAVFEEVGTHVNVDLDRVYATGLSNGGIISYRLACDAADIFAAVAPGAGALGTNDLGWGNADGDLPECTPSEPVSVLDIHGTEDAIVPFSVQEPSVDLMAEKNGCEATTEPATVPPSEGDSTCVSYVGCPDGVDVTACSVEGGGHVWFGSDSCGTGAGPVGCDFVGANSDTLVNTDVIWEFFSRHSK